MQGSLGEPLVPWAWTHPSPLAGHQLGTLAIKLV